MKRPRLLGLPQEKIGDTCATGLDMMDPQFFASDLKETFSNYSASFSKPTKGASSCKKKFPCLIQTNSQESFREFAISDSTLSEFKKSIESTLISTKVLDVYLIYAKGSLMIPVLLENDQQLQSLLSDSVPITDRMFRITTNSYVSYFA